MHRNSPHGRLINGCATSRFRGMTCCRANYLGETSGVTITAEMPYVVAEFVRIPSEHVAVKHRNSHEFRYDFCVVRSCDQCSILARIMRVKDNGRWFVTFLGQASCGRFARAVSNRTTSRYKHAGARQSGRTRNAIWTRDFSTVGRAHGVVRRRSALFAG
jgi:hypothetical protein